MKLYYSAGACSLAPHIAMREAGIEVQLEPVNLASKNFRGGDYKTLNPKGYVPAIEMDNGELLTEGSVILQYIAHKKPEKKLFAAAGTADHFRNLEWLNFVATEMHKSFGALWNRSLSDEAKQVFKEILYKRFDFLEEKLQGKEYLMGNQFNVADAYLFTVLNWANMVKMDLEKWPNIGQYITRIFSRPAVQAAMKAEGLLK